MRRRQILASRRAPQRTEEIQAPKKPAITCPECGQTFKNIAGLRGHVRHKHGDTWESD